MFFILYWIPAHVPLRSTGRDDEAWGHTQASLPGLTRQSSHHPVIAGLDPAIQCKIDILHFILNDGYDWIPAHVPLRFTGRDDEEWGQFYSGFPIRHPGPRSVIPDPDPGPE